MRQEDEKRGPDEQPDEMDDIKKELRVKPDDCRFKGYSSKFEKDVMLYLRNLAVWKGYVNRQLDAFEERFNELNVMLCQIGQQVQKLGCANCEAYKQVKTVCERLAEVTEETRSNLDEYGGIITESTYDNVRTV